MRNTIIASVSTAIIIFIIIGFMKWFKIKGQLWLDQRKIYKWLEENTKDEPNECHVNTMEIAKKTGISEDRVKRACVLHKKIFCFSKNENEWSIWREEPKSAYEGLSVEEIKKNMAF